ncbi:hypothetical protein JVU11DRAFT_9553 [Chiua virens]|nr:hypothetical protein JVU11DRAFT_9553 [Chiua virens]
MSTTQNCPSQMQNQRGQLPCDIAQGVGHLCNQTYTVSLVNFQESTYIPNDTSTNGCTCSWSMYNLISGCSSCLGQSQYPSWNNWIANCGNNASTTSYLPSGYNVSGGIPFWAATNPSSWTNGVFNTTQVSNIVGEGKPDLYGGPLPSSATSTPTASPSSSVPVGAIIGGVTGGVAAVVFGALFVFLVRRRHKKTPATSVSLPSFTVRTPQPAFFENAYSNSLYLTSPVHSTTSLPPTSLASPISSGFSSNEHRMAIMDAADIITPFLATSSMPRKNRSNTSLPMGQVANTVSEGRMTPPAQRVRINPPSYSDSVESVNCPSEGATTTQARRSSRNTHNKQKSSMSGATSYSAHSRTSTWESVTSGRPGTHTEQSRSRATTPVMGTAARSMESTSSAGGGRVHGDRKTGPNPRHRPPAV